MKGCVYIMIENTHQKPVDGDMAFELEHPNPAPLDSDDLIEISKKATDRHDRPIFFSYSEPFDGIDYPNSYECIDILSSRAIKILESNFENHNCQFSRVTVINGLLSENDPREGLEETPDIINASLQDQRFYTEEYFIVEVPHVSGVFDLDQSEYTAYPLNDIGFVEKYVLKLEEIELPPLFSLAERPGPIFITSELRSLWKKHGINGMQYMDLDQSYKSCQIDVEVPNPNIPE